MEKTLQELIMETLVSKTNTAEEACGDEKLIQDSLLELVDLTKEKNENSQPKESTVSLLRQIEDIVNGTPDLGLVQAGETESVHSKIYAAVYGNLFNSAQDASLENYGYDMVVSLTLGSINSTMLNYVRKMKSPPVSKYYMECEDGSVREATKTETAEMDKLKLFDIPAEESKRTEKQETTLKEAYDNGLTFAFKGGFGIPDGATPEKLGAIIDFNKGETGNHSKVIYYLFFKELAVIQLKQLRGSKKIQFIKKQQDKDLWKFKFYVDLSLAGTDIGKLPPELKNKINNLDPGAMFSIQQLFLDLNVTRLQDAPIIEGLEPETRNFLSTYFTGVYFEELRKTGDVIFAYTVKPTSAPSKPYILKPTDFRFYVSPYLTNNKEDESKKKLYTLNYLVMSDGRAMPKDLKQFTWNWVDEKNYSSIHGAMTINKQRIYDFAIKEFTDVVGKFLLKPYVKMNCSLASISTKMNLSTDESAKPVFNNNSYSYSKKDYSEDNYFVLWGNIALEYTNENTVKTLQTTDNKVIFECASNIRTHLRLNVEGGVSSGNIFNRTLYYRLEVSVDTYGNLSFKPTVDEHDNGTNFKINDWSKFISGGEIEGHCNAIKQFIIQRINGAKEFASRDFKSKYNGHAMWVLPGDQSFTFKNPILTQGKDLSFSLQYVNPNNSDSKGR